MPISPSLSRKLRETLGADAGGDLVTWLDEQREESAQLRADMAELDGVMKKRFDQMEARISQRFDRLDAALAERFGRVYADVASVKSDLMKWSFVFWCGAVAAIAALAGVLRG